MDDKELIKELRKTVQLVKDSGSINANKAYTARTSDIAKLLSLTRKLNEAK